MDLATNNNNNHICDSSSKVELEPEHHHISIPSKPSNGHEGLKKSEQFVGGNEKTETKRTNPRQQKQQENSFPKDALASPILLASNSNGFSISAGGSEATQEDPSLEWWTEETSFSGFRIRAGGGKVSSTKYRENVSGSGAGKSTRERDNKIDSDVMVVGKKGGFGGKQEQDPPGTTTVAEPAASSSLYHRLARVDPIVDFFAVDEELLGRFRICSCLSHQLRRNSGCSFSSARSGGGSGGSGGGIQQQHAIIFKIKTTSPHSFWVRPIYGLMRPNVIAWVEVKCELKANSLVKLVENMDEFLVEICPVPGAINMMTNDLYTNCVRNNVPELLNIWERVEQELKENQQHLQGFVKEFHRVSCRFQRSSQSCSVGCLAEPIIPMQYSAIQQQGTQDDANSSNNNTVENLQSYRFNPMKETEPSSSESQYQLAREFPHYHPSHHLEEGNSVCAHSSRLRQEQCGLFAPGMETRRRSCCSGYDVAVRKLCCLSIILAFSLFCSLAFILYTQYYQYLDRSFHDNAKKNIGEQKYYKSNNNIDFFSSNNKRRDFNS